MRVLEYMLELLHEPSWDCSLGFALPPTPTLGQQIHWQMAAAEGDESSTAVGGREVNADGINTGILRCPRCNCRLLTGHSKLVEKDDDARTLWIPRPVAGEANRFDWESAQHTWWWEIATG